MHKALRCVATKVAVFLPLFLSPLIGQLTCQTSQPRVATPVPADGKHFPDVDQYGTASGQVAAPTSFVQMFGFPLKGATIELQLRGARPNASAIFYLSSDHADQQVPGLGRVLVDLSAADTYTATTDPQGRASVFVTIPSTAEYGHETYVQCITYDAARVPELSKALYFEVGEVQYLSMMSTIDGTVNVVDRLGVALPPGGASGVYNYAWTPGRAGTVVGGLAIVAETNISTPSGLIQDLVVQSNGDGSSVTWTSASFHTINPAIADRFWVSYTHQGVAYGPFSVAAVTSADDCDIDTNLSPLPTVGGGPLAGASISLQLVKVCLEPSTFDGLDNLEQALNSIMETRSLTGADVDAEFDRTELLMARAIAAFLGNTASFDSTMPSHAEFLAREAVYLRALTDGRASTVDELRTLSGGSLTAHDTLGLFIAKLLAALGIDVEIEQLKELFDEEIGDEFKKFRKHCDEGKWKKAGKSIKKMMKKIASKEFAKKAAAKLGAQAAAKFLAKVASKCVPFVGWGVFILSLLWAYVEQAVEA